METKRNNLKFIGIREPRRGDSYTSVEQQVVDVLNEFSTSPCWHLADVNRAFRVGVRQERSDQPRPLIIQFYRWKDKMAILNDRNLRDKLRRAGIKVTSDLTSRQRDTLDFYRSQGKIAYYRNGRLHFADRLDSFPRSRHHESYSQALRSDGHYLQSDEWPQLPRHRQEEPWSQQRARDHSPRRDAYHRRNAPPRRDGDMASESSQHSAAGNDVPRRRAPGQTRQAGNGPRDQSGNQSSQQYYVSKHAPDLRDTGEEKGDTVSPVTSERGAQPREQRGQNSRRDIDRHGNSAHDNHQDRTSGEAKGARPRPVAPGTPPMMTSSDLEPRRQQLKEERRQQTSYKTHRKKTNKQATWTHRTATMKMTTTKALSTMQKTVLPTETATEVTPKTKNKRKTPH